jgi:predicted lactoylglutathione lyase
MAFPFVSLVPMTSVRDVSRSIDFYLRIGFEVGNRFTPPDGRASCWTWLESRHARLMVSSDRPPPPAAERPVRMVSHT